MAGLQLQRRRVSKLKKFLVIILGAIFVLSFAASAFAIHAEIPSETQAVVAKGTTQISIDGELRTRGWYLNNIDEGRAPADTSSAAYYDERVRLAVDAKVTPNVEGYIQLESNSGAHDLYTWGNFNAKPDASPSFLQAWILYSGQGLFGFPAGLKVGHMPLYLADKEFFDHSKFGDDAIVFFMLPTKELEIDLLTIKFAGDGNTNNIDTFGISNYVGSRFDNTADLDGYVGIVTYKMDPNNTLGINYTYLNLPDLGFSHQDLGLIGKGNIAGLGYDATLDIQFGSVDALGQDFKGWAVQAGLSYMLDPVNLREMFAYGSGDNNANDGDDKNFETYLGSDQHFTLVYDYNLITTAGRTASGLTNTTYYNLGADFAATKDLKASLDGYVIRASKTADGVSKDAGWEIDGRISYNVAKNLTYVVDAGYFKAGDFYVDSGLGDNKGATVLKHTLTLSF
jgi:hypothetical protein